MQKDIQRVLISQQQLQSRITELAEQVSAEYAGKNPVFVGVLKGVVMFFGDFVKQVSVPCQIDFMCISSYSGTDSTGKMQVKMDLSTDIRDRHVVIVEDIFDTGNSLSYTYDYLLAMKPASLKIVTLLDKPERRKPGVTVKADYTGFVIPNEFVVGYGMDYNEYYRNLPFIGILKPEVYM
ncbi:MAG: hypoxanthine phosphoribosyltransferase [Oscillospiraceae bacterium]|nr:hypoxanthine phosphoribosyltransferase [Oscillospiraceae bacterium]